MEPFIGEVLLFGGNFAPRGWAFCDGQLLAISQNSALFSILGTTYGGDGRTSFGLPDLRGRAAAGSGNGPGLSAMRLGQKVGFEEVTLTVNQIPSHNHTVAVQGSSDPGDEDSAAGNVLGSKEIYQALSKPAINMASNGSAPTGGNREHENMQPFIALNYIIALVGIYPSRS